VYQVATDVNFTTLAFPATTVQRGASGQFEWLSTFVLDPNRTYFVRVFSYTARVQADEVTANVVNPTVNRFTTAAPFSVTLPTAFPICGFTLTADPFAGTSSVRIRYAAGTFSSATDAIWTSGSVSATEVTANSSTSFSALVPKATDPLLLPNTTYTVRVQAFNSASTLMATVLRTIQTASGVSASITSPSPDGVTGVSVLPTITSSITSLPCGTAASVTYQLATNSTFTAGLQSASIPASPANTFPWTLTSPLQPDTEYFVRVTSATITTNGQTRSTTINAPQVTRFRTAPFLVSVPNPVSSCGFNVIANAFSGTEQLEIRYASGTITDFNANQFTNNGAINTQVIAFPVAPGNDFIAPVPNATNQRLLPGTYTLRIQALSPAGTVMARVLRTINVVAPDITASVTLPANEATNVSVLPTFTASTVAPACGVITGLVYQVSSDPAFSSIDFASPTVTSAGNFSWTATTALLPNTLYYARVVTGLLSLDGRPGVTVNVASPIPTISFRTAPFNVTAPLANAKVDVCGFTVTADPFAGANRLLVTYAVGANISASNNTIWSNTTVITSGVTIAADPETGSFSGVVPKSSALRLLPGTFYTLRIQAYNAGGTLMATVMRTVETNPSATTYLPVFGAQEPVQAPGVIVTVPANGSTNVSITPTIKVGKYEGCPDIFTGAMLEIAYVGPAGATNEPNWNALSTIRIPYLSNSPGPYTFTVPITNNAGLLPQSVYKARFTFSTTSNQPNNAATITFTTGNFLLPTRVLQVNNGNSFVQFANGAYRNGATQRFRAQLVGQATAYDWQFSTDNVNFSNPITLSSSDIALEFNAAANGFESGARYFVRVRARDNSGNASLYPSPGSPDIVNYHHPLFAPYVTSPTVDNLETRRFTVKSTIVGNGTNFFFQIAKANPENDGNPLADFTLGNYFQNPTGYPVSNLTSFSLASNVGGAPVEAVNGPGGNLFHALDWRQYWWGVEVRFNYLQMQPQTKYRVRVIAARMVDGQFVQQTDLGLVGITNFGTMGIPNRMHNILNIADNETDVENRESLAYTRITVQGAALLWDITRYQLQVSETSFSGPDDTRGIIENIDGVTEGNPVFMVPGLKFFTKYYVRARSLATVNGIPQWSAWSGPAEGGISFTTKRVPMPSGIALNNVTSNRSAQISVDRVSVADRYEWTLERISDGPDTYPIKVTDWVNATFTENLVQGVQYRLTVRAFSSAQAPDDAAYSQPVSTTFTINSNAARNANEPAAAGTTEFLSSALFPNPFQRETKLQLNTGYGKVQVKAVSLSGQVMLLKEATGGDTVLLGLNWPAGMYIVQVVTEKGVSETYRIVKQ
jgi:hypothetical protein